MSNVKKMIQINPELFKINGSRTKKIGKNSLSRLFLLTI